MPHHKPKPKHSKAHKRPDTSIAGSILSDIKNANLFRLALSSFRSWYMNWPWIILAVLVDLVFIISLSSVITLIQFTLFEHLEALMRLLGEATGGILNMYNQTAQVAAGALGVTSSPEFQYHLSMIFKYLGLMVLITFVLWVIFQGISWYIAHRMSTDKRQSFLIFWKNFALESLPFYALSILWIFLSIRLLFSIKMSITPMISEEALNAIFIIFMLITWYFGSICYTITNKYAYKNFKQSFIFGIKRFPKIIQSFLFLLILFIIIDAILRIGIIRANPYILMITGTILFMPAVVYARILLFKTTKAYWKENA
jgi:hypothetical protein